LFKFIIKRVIGLVPLFIGITFISFVVIHLAPGSPVEARSQLNPKMSLEAQSRLKELYGLDAPLFTQYVTWAKRLFRLDFGRSFSDGEEVSKKISEAIPVTLLISGLSLLLILSVGIPLGIFSAVRKGSLPDKALTFLSFTGISIPTFWLALLGMSFFGVTLRWLPVSGLHSVLSDEMSFFESIIDTAWHLILPVTITFIAGVGAIICFMRSSMASTLKESYIRTAIAKGLSQSQVLYKHALKNAILPLITILGLSVPGLLGGSVLFETVFSLPGMGRLFFNAVFMRDYPVVMGILVMGAFLTLLGNLLADIAYGIADPRIRIDRNV